MTRFQKGFVKWVDERTGSIIGTANVEVPVDGAGFPHYAHFCPLCGDIWAREWWEVKRENGREHWFTRDYLCARHERGGHLIRLTEGALVRTASPALLLYEFNHLYAALPTHMKPQELR